MVRRKSHPVRMKPTIQLLEQELDPYDRFKLLGARLAAGDIDLQTLINDKTTREVIDKYLFQSLRCSAAFLLHRLVKPCFKNKKEAVKLPRVKEFDDMLVAFNISNPTSLMWREITGKLPKRIFSAPKEER